MNSCRSCGWRLRPRCGLFVAVLLVQSFLGCGGEATPVQPPLSRPKSVSSEPASPASSAPSSTVEAPPAPPPIPPDAISKHIEEVVFRFQTTDDNEVFTAWKSSSKNCESAVDSTA